MFSRNSSPQLWEAGGSAAEMPDPLMLCMWSFRLQFPQLALRRRLGQLSCMSRPALKLRSWPLTILYYLLPFGALKPLTRVGWRPMSRVSVSRSRAPCLGAVCPGGAGSSWGESCFMQDSLVITGVKAEVQFMLLFSFYCSWCVD